jgi:hypothetical protein
VLALTLVLVADLARLHPEPTATALAETRLRTLVRATATDLGAAVRVLARAAEHASTAASTDLVLALLEAVVFGHSPPVRSLTHSVRTLRTDPTNERAWLALGHLVDVLDGD